MHLIKIVTRQLADEKDAADFEAKVTEYLNDGWRVQSSHIFSSSKENWDVGFILIRHPHFATGRNL